MGKFIISKRTNGEFQFNLVASNGQTVLTSEGYTSKAGCENGIESVKRNAPQDERFEMRTSANNKVYFVLKSTNGQIVGTSQMYESQASCIHGVASVKNSVLEAFVEDMSVV